MERRDITKMLEVCPEAFACDGNANHFSDK